MSKRSAVRELFRAPAPTLGRGLFALRRFSGLGHTAVAIALVTGISNSWFLPYAELDPPAPYKDLLLGKVLLVGRSQALVTAGRMAAE